jgi:hypothetical protein
MKRWVQTNIIMYAFFVALNLHKNCEFGKTKSPMSGLKRNILARGFANSFCTHVSYYFNPIKKMYAQNGSRKFGRKNTRHSLGFYFIRVWNDKSIRAYCDQTVLSPFLCLQQIVCLTISLAETVTLEDSY